jgi:hypothetical protein
MSSVAFVYSASAQSQSDKEFRAYGGVLGSVSGSFIPEPKNKTIEIGGQTLIAPYPGFGGVGGGGGGAHRDRMESA